MQLPVRSPVTRYLAAVAAVAVATMVTATIPLLHDRLTFFAFWPVIFLTSWLWGVGPGIVSSALSAVSVLVFLRPYGMVAAPFALTVTIGVFVVAGAMAAFLTTWRQRAEEELRESRDRFRMLANSAPVLIWVADASGRRIFFNDPWLRFTGRRVEEESGDGWLRGVHPDDRESCRHALATAAARRAPFQVEYRLRRHDGLYRAVVDQGAPRLREDGVFEGHVGSCVDITEQQRARERVEEALAQAEKANRAKDAFLATVSHELRTPLSPIVAWARMMRDGKLDDAQRMRAVEVIERNARMQAQLVEDLLDVSRIVEGRLRLSVRPVGLVQIIESALETVRQAADAKGVRLHAVLDSTVAPISGDPDRLQQVMWNLLSNAVKFTPRGGRVHVVLERVDSSVEIVVSDTGKGIAPDELPHLFERFWQADRSPTRAHGGLGLGLAIVRHLVELHGGTVTAESAGENHGASFTVRLPLAPFSRRAVDDVRRHPLLADGRVRPRETRLDGMRALVVDDEPDANEVVRTFLAQSGAEVRVAASCSQALEILSRWLPDVIVSDVGMPGEDGYALIAKVRTLPGPVGRLPAVALTAYASTEDRVRLLSADFQMHVAKPADPAEITAAVAAVVTAAP
ncbi:MAG: ATP-binding protein, partial [Thermodesulfobacteriota bacterium]